MRLARGARDNIPFTTKRITSSKSAIADCILRLGDVKIHACFLRTTPDLAVDKVGRRSTFDHIVARNELRNHMGPVLRGTLPNAVIVYQECLEMIKLDVKQIFRTVTRVSRAYAPNEPPKLSILYASGVIF